MSRSALASTASVRKRAMYDVCGEAGCYLPKEHGGECAFHEAPSLPDLKKHCKAEVAEISREARLAGYSEVLQMLEARAAEKAVAAAAASVSTVWDTTMSESSDDQREQALELAMFVEHVASDPARAWTPPTVPAAPQSADPVEPHVEATVDAEPAVDAGRNVEAASGTGREEFSQSACEEQPSSELPRPPKPKKTVRWSLPAEVATRGSNVRVATGVLREPALPESKSPIGAEDRSRAGSGQQRMASMELMSGSRSKAQDLRDCGCDWAY